MHILLAPADRADCGKNSVFQIHGIGPGPTAKPTMYPITHNTDSFGRIGFGVQSVTQSASGIVILRITVRAAQLKYCKHTVVTVCTYKNIIMP